MSIAQHSRRRAWARINRMAKGFGRAFAMKKLTAIYGTEVAAVLLKRYESNQRVRA